MTMNMSVLAAATTMLLAAAAPASAQNVEVVQQQVQYSCGVFNPNSVNATYHYAGDQVTQVTLQYADQELVLPVNQAQGKTLVFSSGEHQWTVSKPHPDHQQTHPLNDGELAQLKPHAAKGQVFAVAKKMESNCFAEVM
ncbi:hypothetical protein RMN64_06185 [Plesiomonas shigelloides]|uniref:hypothetical protein n=1 Tax=Plesiomonas shigelloides TaxID=703 RepID=UPI0028872986|nr:hypothetical protein [Plesiomonas shigelloides]MDT1011019.1 hypothetical protein [Plesiomonas shigelloides]